MKKILIVSFLTLIPILNAKAADFRPYIGTTINYTTKYKIEDVDDSDIHLKKKAELSINLGSKIDLGENLFASGEIYSNIIGNTLKTEDGDPNTKVKNLFGFNLGLGYNITERFNAQVFASLDRNKVKSRYDADPLDPNVNFSKSKFGFGTGILFGFNVTENVETKFGYKFSRTKYKETLDGNAKAKIHSVNLGLAYNF